MDKLVKKLKTPKITKADIANLVLYFMIYRDYINNKDANFKIGMENHNLSNFFIHIGKVPEEFVQELEWQKFQDLNELRQILETRQYEDKAIIIDLKKKCVSNNTTIINVHKVALMNFNVSFSEHIKRFSDLKKRYFSRAIGTKREYALALHLATSKPVIISSQSVVNVFSTGSIYYFIQPGIYLRTYLKQIFSLPYSYYVDPLNFAALVVEIHVWDKRSRKIKMLKKQIINWKDYFEEFFTALMK